MRFYFLGAKGAIFLSQISPMHSIFDQKQLSKDFPRKGMEFRVQLKFVEALESSFPRFISV